MVALNESFASEYPSLGSKNRVGDFFAKEGKSRPVNRLAAQQPRLEKAHAYDETASGMFFYGFRYYDPVTGRWPSRDPIGENGGINIYHYVWNDPINWYDPFGESPSSGRRSDDRTGTGNRYNDTPPRPDGFPGFPSTFRHNGKWGGAGWVSGKWMREDGTDGPLPRPGDPDYQPPESDRDACYEGHDICINQCPPGTPCPEDAKKRSDCEEGCDQVLGNCLFRLGNPLLWPEALMFKTVIPWLVH